jgi:hypothetical protein
MFADIQSTIDQYQSSASDHLHDLVGDRIAEIEGALPSTKELRHGTTTTLNAKGEDRWREIRWKGKAVVEIREVHDAMGSHLLVTRPRENALSVEPGGASEGAQPDNT